MSLRRKLISAVGLTVFGVAAYFIYGAVYTWWRIPEAYAAWDTGTLLVEYMKSHDNRWPLSWDDLLAVVRRDSGEEIILRGARAGDTNYVASLSARVAIDWRFDPSGDNHGCQLLAWTVRNFRWCGKVPSQMRWFTDI
jgi:hypothetical protein